MHTALDQAVLPLVKREVAGLFVCYDNPNAHWVHVRLWQVVNYDDGWEEIHSNDPVVIPPGGSRMFEVPCCDDYHEEVMADYGFFVDPPVFDTVMV